MEEKKKNNNIFEDKGIYQTNPYKPKQTKNTKFIRKLPNNINLIQRCPKLINFILLQIIFLFLPKRITAQNYMEIKVNQLGYNQIFSDVYTGSMPSKVLYDEMPFLLVNKVVYVESLDNPIYFEWEDSIIDFSFMFNNITSINSIKINFPLPNNCNMSNMFSNCSNLNEFIYNIDSSSSINIDMNKMFYNCSSLKSFEFQKLKLNNANTSYMFFNCINLDTFNFIYYSFNVIDMKGMFYNCISLEEIKFETIGTNTYIDTSYMFYNCSNLTSFIIINNNFNCIKIKEIKYMFYNCTSLNKLNINYFINTNNYINMTNLFCNCYSLTAIEGSFYNLLISDTSKMFYNCYSLETLNFNPRRKNVKIYINMTKMFYNCQKINKITFQAIDYYGYYDIFDNYYKNYYSLYPNDLSYTFYNCSSLDSLNFQYFVTSDVKEVRYMMFNCKSLINIYLTGSSFKFSLATNMRGIFQNCESLKTIGLSSLDTRNVEIMWDMFKGCKSLINLNLGNFNTKKVIDMESMFEGCESLTTLSLTTFDTSNVHYMNKMFSGCTKLETVDFNSISSNSLGTMYQMFYNCVSLKYLNIFTLTEKSQSIYKMFEGASDSFKLCIEDDKNIPNIFKEILKKPNIERDCSEKCYGRNNQRYLIPQKKLCCANFAYNDNCYDKCPPRTKVKNTPKKCENFTCSLYNFEQDGCQYYMPEGYFLNDTELHTIDKCHANCKTCIKGPTSNKMNCVSCKSSSYLKYQFLGNCLSSCEHGSFTDFTDNRILKCKCVTEECSDCSEESLDLNLCKSCASNYYIKNDESSLFGNFKKCYKDPPRYYLNNYYQRYYNCYSSCERCYGQGNFRIHNCLMCDSNHTFEMIKNISGIISKNCYAECEYYYYFEDDLYYCTEDEQCPPDYNFIIAGTKQCVKSCNDTQGYFKQFRNYCYKECPPIISYQREDNPFLCRVICTFELPFELVETQYCTKKCTIMERSNKLCITNYFGNRTNLEIQEIIYDDISRDLTDSFDFSVIKGNDTVFVEENETMYEIIASNNNNKKSKTSYIDFGKCENILKDYYGLAQDVFLIMLKMDTFIEGKTGPTSLYEIFYPLYSNDKLVRLDLTPCEGQKISVLYNMELVNPELYDKNNPVYSDICFPYIIKDGADTTLGDLQRDFTNNNKSLCEENCDYIGYDEENKFYECDCDMKESLPKISEIKSDKAKLYFFDAINKVANFDVLRCVNLITTKDGLIKNIGFYSFMPTIVVYFYCLWQFYKKENKLIKGDINNLAEAKKKIYEIKKEKMEKEKKAKEEMEKRFSNLVLVKQKVSNESAFVSYLKGKNEYEEKEKKKENNEKILKQDIINNLNTNKKKIIKYAKVTSKYAQFIQKTSKNIFEDASSSSDGSIIDDIKKEEEEEKEIDLDKQVEIIIFKNRNRKNLAAPVKKQNSLNQNKSGENNASINDKKSKNNNNTNENNKNEDNKIEDENKNKNEDNKNEDENKNKNKDLKINDIMKYNDRELNDLNYKSAFKYDKRTFCEFYLSLLRTDHLLMKVSNTRDYNSRAVKIYLCLYNFGLSFAVNALFFDDEAIEQIFIDSGQFNIIYQIPQIIYSSVISFFFGEIIDMLALSEESVLNLKGEKASKNSINNAKKIVIILQIKFLYFFILSFAFLLMIWYYITCFCAVYKNTQYHLIKDTLIGYFYSLLSPFATKLIPGIFRIYGIKRNSVILFKFSKILEMVC